MQELDLVGPMHLAPFLVDGEVGHTSGMTLGFVIFLPGRKSNQEILYQIAALLIYASYSGSFIKVQPTFFGRIII